VGGVSAARAASYAQAVAEVNGLVASGQITWDEHRRVMGRLWVWFGGEARPDEWGAVIRAAHALAMS
jgi:hypothetical protein